LGGESDILLANSLKRRNNMRNLCNKQTIPQRDKYQLPVPKNMVDIRPAPFHTTHKSMRYFVDFALPEGTPIMAIADGVVIARESRFAKSYEDPKFVDKANYVEIRHPNGYSSCYVHLKWHSVKVKIGQRVRRGQIVALSGCTGYATYPHLHFGLYDKDGNNVPVRFVDLKGRKG